MTTTSPQLAPAALCYFALISLCMSTLLSGCSVTTTTTEPSELGKQGSTQTLLSLLNQPGPITLQKHLAARWSVDRAGLINLDHPQAREAGLESGPEPIELYFYSITHPNHGTYVVDSGIAESFRKPASNADVSWLVRTAMNTEALQVKLTMTQWLAKNDQQLDGVFLTHLHLDHILGLADIPSGTPVYTGPGETHHRALVHAATQGTTDRLLSYAGTLREWQFSDDPANMFEGVLDVFGDGSLWALHVPGHSPGSTAFVVRTPNGPHLLLGDASHTAWGWRNGVEPGEFSMDTSRSAVSLARLQKLAARAESLLVHPGHQSLQPEDPHVETTQVSNSRP